MPKRDICPICGTPPASEYKPFCSRGCKDRDLLQWLGEGYRVPGEPVDFQQEIGQHETGLDRARDAD